MMFVELLFLLVTLRGVSLQQCNQTPVSTLLQGCKNLKGLTIYSKSGNTVVDDRNCGDIQQKSEFLLEPRFQYTMADENNLYTLVVVDPDAPFMEPNNFLCHMIRANIPGSQLKYNTTCCKKQGNSIVDYLFPAPTPGPAHRYISLLFINLGDYLVRPSDAPLFRSNFNLEAWLKGKGLCGPVAATEFRIRNIISSSLS